jgi:hypothetical protein
MADLSITAAEVLPGSDAVKISGYNFGATVTQGKVVYLDSSDNNDAKLADASDASLDAAYGIALNAGGDGQPAVIQTGGSITLGASASLSVGKVYVLSDTAGGIMPIDDAVAAGTLYCTVLGVATSASVLKMGIIVSGVEYAADVS